MNPEPQTHDSQLSMEIDWTSDADSSIPHNDMNDLDPQLQAISQNNDDLSAILGLDTCNSDSNAETLQEGIENPCSKAQSTAMETETCLVGASQPTTSVLLPIADANESTLHPVHSTPELRIQKASETNSKGGDDQPIPEVSSTRELEVCRQET